jgi:hypothetical protein
MGLFQLISRWNGECKLNELSETIAARSFDHVWRRVVHRGAILGPNEMRGYLRARATHLIYQQIAELSRQGVVVKDAALERLIPMTLDVLQRQIAARLKSQRNSHESQRRAA